MYVGSRPHLSQCLLSFASINHFYMTNSRWLNHKAVTYPASSLEQDKECSPAETRVLTTMLRRQQYWSSIFMSCKLVPSY